MSRLVGSSGDPAIPTLASVLDPSELAKQLSPLPFVQRRWDASQEIEVRVLKWWEASRCTFEIALGTSNGRQELIGKVYAENRSDVFQAMEEIWRAGFDSEQEFGIPRPIAFLTSLRLLLYEKVPGTRAKKLLVGSNESDRAPAAERCARWLARFQALAPRLGRTFHLNDHLVSLERAGRSFVDLGQPCADKANQLFKSLNAAATELDGIQMCAGHGTFTPGQVLLTEERTVTIDWDTYNVSDPTYDVARFVVEMKRMGLKYFGSMHALDGLAEVFVKAYVAARHLDVVTHLRFQEAAICLERAKNDVDKQARGWRERTEAMLNEGLRILDQGAN